MGTPFVHCADHALVVFVDPLTWESAFDLGTVLDNVTDHYFYTLVELLIASPGGNTQALRQVLDVLEDKRRSGVRFRTRVVSEAGSGAAVLACLGDDRVAGPHARLLFHSSRLHNVEALTARDSAAIGTVLRGVDEVLLRSLVDRVLLCDVAPDAPPREAALDSDRAVLEALWPETRKGSRGAAAPRKLRTLARAVGRTVAEAVRRRDRDTLSRLYRRVVELESPVSSQLACTLHLIDRVDGADVDGVQEPPSEAEAIGLTIPEWAPLFAPDGAVPRSVLTRHTLALGETGSGKTASAILPVLAAMAREQPGRLGTALIIDPKRELLPVLSQLAPDRLLHVHTRDLALNLMDGPRWSLEDDLAQGRWLSAANRILCRAASFVRTNPARVLLDHAVGDANAEFFDREGTSLCLSLLALVLALLHCPGLAGSQGWLDGPDNAQARAWLRELSHRAQGDPAAPGPNVFALVDWVLQGSALSQGSGVSHGLIVSQGSTVSASSWFIARLCRAAREALGDQLSPEGRDLFARLEDYWPAMLGISGQFAGVRAVAASICSDYCHPAIRNTLYFGCEPGHVERANGLDFSWAVASRGNGPLVLFQPARDGLDILVAVALKARFFEAVLDDPDRLRDGAAAPLVAYVADEFQRFATSDPIHGEQSFLDCCRSFGAFCLLACQSVASIEHALAHGGGEAVANRSALAILWNNTATKLVFRSTDPHTAERISELCPYRPGLAAVTRVRPVSTLAPGECYAVLADGRFERRQLKPYVPLPDPVAPAEPSDD